MLRATTIARCPQGKMGGRGLYWKKPSWNATRKANAKERVQSVEYFLRKHNNNDEHKGMPKRKLYEEYTADELPWYDREAHKAMQRPAIGEGFHLPSNRALRHQLRPKYSPELFTPLENKESD